MPDPAFRVRLATPADEAAVYGLCLRTADAGADATALHAHPDLPGHVYAGAYLHVPPAFALIAEDAEGVAGYVLGTPDTPAFEDALARAWWPALRDRYPLGTSGTPHDARLIAHLHSPARTPGALTGTHPAHLHINLAERARGRGVGRALVLRALQGAQDAGAPALHLGVDDRNAGALAFYPRVGFQELNRAPGVVWFGRPTTLTLGEQHA
ncbi:GNAT family N-acetyltransferase [Deinococcus maricopensis]|uniref:GCN5-related N-acetyltransferase n=1 Tax=Deinococcus maricopensis (strain DSM 21211 / LMG 22137 / NRRL B-23946 / LB-34) TaxID=709986 RepID=E8U632_DEIML|nr:GNAT family N-acetyltransferase [Deinococcus maricopensis]ADV66521.1 GCN5-related N-acetyltransferase [Deinococcus maricopensis DSM 21211]